MTDFFEWKSQQWREWRAENPAWAEVEALERMWALPARRPPTRLDPWVFLAGRLFERYLVPLRKYLIALGFR